MLPQFVEFFPHVVTLAKNGKLRTAGKAWGFG
jgi:hypothetical protein